MLVLANGSTWLLKEHLLTRPDLGLDEVAPATLNSLPSGHTTAAFSAVAALLVVLAARVRAPTALFGGGFAALTALATMFAGWHRAADAMAAFLVVGVCTMVAISAVVVLAGPPPEGSAPASTTERLRWWVAPSVGALVLGSVLAAALSLLAPVRDTLVGSLMAFMTASLLIVGTLVGVLVGMLRVLEATDGAGRDDDPT